MSSSANDVGKMLSLSQRIRSVHDLCNFSPSPQVQFEKQRRNLAPRSKQRATVLSAVFADTTKKGVCYLPKELIRICVMYMRESVESMILETLSSCRAIPGAGGFMDFLRSQERALWNTIIDSDKYDSVDAFARTIDDRCSIYLKYFTAKREEIDVLRRKPVWASISYAESLLLL
jgi:hypothetical protein